MYFKHYWPPRSGKFLSELTNTFYWQYKIYCAYIPFKMTNTSELSKCWGEITESESKILN